MTYLSSEHSWNDMSVVQAGHTTHGWDTFTRQTWSERNSSSIIAKSLILSKLTLPFIGHPILS